MDIALFNPLQQSSGLAEMEFARLADVDDGEAGVFWSGAGGPSPWEMHPDCDEVLHVMEGEVTVEILPSQGGESTLAVVKSGWYLVVPRGCWHRQTVNTTTRELYLTPGQTLHSTAQDPRAG